MLRPIYHLLPVFLLNKIALKYCERVRIDGVVFVCPFSDVLIRLDEEKQTI